MKKSRNHLVIFLNGQRLLVSAEDCLMMAAEFLRYQRHLTGTKIVCAEGDCGACTILIYRPGIDTEFVPVNACIIPMIQLDGCFLLTIEALKDNGKLSLVQEAIVQNHGSQCGYCTPGFAMAMSACFQEKKSCSPQKIKNCLTGNLCRCTGYQPFIDAAHSLNDKDIPSLVDRFIKASHTDELLNAHTIALKLVIDSFHLEAPLTLDEVDALYAQQEYKLFAGATDLGVHINKGKSEIKKMLSLQLIKKLYEVKEENGRIVVGARVSLENLRKFVKNRIPILARFISIFASPQIKNMGTLIGNIANASPIADFIPFMLVADGEIHARSIRGKRTIDITNFFLGYKKVDLLADEYISHVSFRIPHNSERLVLDKVSQRRDLDIATVNAAFLLNREERRITDVKIAVGGVGPTVQRLHKTEKFLRGTTIEPISLNDARQFIQQEINPQDDLRGSASYRRLLVDNLFMRFCSEL